ncbi:MAG TPA: PPOX class F420-dependent oxidoreductase [Ilumatobacteraceae bacterium]|nr:PPOX class F420-dependent oxidoreductase [Ilumatobacteraceae bacterium]
MTLGDEKYVLLTTYRRDGTPVASPVWVVPLAAGRIGIETSSGSGKAKRLAHTSNVTVQPCGLRGAVKAGTEPVEATAALVSGSDLVDIRQKIHAKYGFITKITALLNKIAGVVKRKRIPYGDCGVIITPR